MKPTKFLACAVGPGRDRRLQLEARRSCQQRNAPVNDRRTVAAARAATGPRSSIATPAGGFMMGNPNAKVKLIEYRLADLPALPRVRGDGRRRR